EDTDRADRHGFLADVQVAEAPDLAECVGLRALLFKTAAQQHLIEQTVQGLAVQAAQRTLVAGRLLDRGLARRRLRLRHSALHLFHRLSCAARYPARPPRPRGPAAPGHLSSPPRAAARSEPARAAVRGRSPHHRRVPPPPPPVPAHPPPGSPGSGRRRPPSPSAPASRRGSSSGPAGRTPRAGTPAPPHPPASTPRTPRASPP